MESKYKETVITSGDLAVLKDQYLFKNVYRYWNFDAVDEDTGETIVIPRREQILDRGTLIDHEVLSRINFYMQTGDISEVTISNIQRTSSEVSLSINVWVVSARVLNKTYNYYLYADSLTRAYEIAVDYCEQKISNDFAITGIKRLTNYSNLIPESDLDSAVEQEFYSIEIEFVRDDVVTQSTYTIQATDAETAKELIVNYIVFNDKDLSDVKDGVAFETRILSAKIIKCAGIIPYSFSKEHIDNQLNNYSNEI